jgi:hypothetical protein
MCAVLAVLYPKYEIPLFRRVYSNLVGKTGERQYVAGSFSGALSFSARAFGSRAEHAPHAHLIGVRKK